MPDEPTTYQVTIRHDPSDKEVTFDFVADPSQNVVDEFTKGVWLSPQNRARAIGIEGDSFSADDFTLVSIKNGSESLPLT